MMARWNIWKAVREDRKIRRETRRIQRKIAARRCQHGLATRSTLEVAW